MKPIYEPKGRAKEYGDLCVNIYTGCPHRCFYCFAPSVLRRDREQFHGNVKPREGIVDAVKEQLEKEQITGKTIHLCFTCDPYPNGSDTQATREIITAIKAAGNFVQILTKGDGTRDFDLLGENDWFGVTISGAERAEEPEAIAEVFRLAEIVCAKNAGIKTWVSFEPVINAERVLETIDTAAVLFDKVKIGKLNYHTSEINWAEFGRAAEALCKSKGLEYYIKADLRKEMEAAK